VRPITHAIPGALMALLRDTPLSDGKVAFAWGAVVGPAVERVTTVKLERGVLIVEAASAQWSQEIQRSKGVILMRLAKLLGAGTITRIETRLKAPI
jgi:hypothetical protein